MKVIFVALLLVLIKEAEMSQNELVCDSDSRVKLSVLNGLREHHVMKEIRVHELKTEVDEAQNKINETESAMLKMKRKINATHDEADQIKTMMENMTTPQLEQLEELEICSEDGFVADCCEIKRMYPSAPSGIYAIKDPCAGDNPFSYAKLAVYCDMETDGGGWIVIQRRNASMGWVNFTRNISDYEKGFGDIDGEFWIGLKVIHELTNQQPMALKMKMWDSNGNSMNWNYQRFSIYEKRNRYALYHVSGSSGDGRYDAFGQSININTDFQTFDYYRPGWGNCGYTRQSGWWYYHGNCNSYSNPNGRHQPSGRCEIDQTGERLVWRMSSGYRIYTHSEMKIRPQSCNLS